MTLDKLLLTMPKLNCPDSNYQSDLEAFLTGNADPSLAVKRAD